MKGDPRDEKLTLLFKKYVGSSRILVADASATSRAAVGGTLTALGAQMSQITLASSFEEAEQAVETMIPKIVICEYDLGRRCGLDLLQRQRAKNPEFKSSLFVLVTGNTSQSAVARAAEEDVDTYVLKPFTAEILRQSILKAAVTKISPSDYVKAIEKGKDLIAAGNVDEAITVFEGARSMDPAPSLACFYLGQCAQMKQVLDGAQTKYQDGLQFNKIHYKCMVGLFEVLMEKKRFTEAYDVVRRVAQYFPANPQRLTSVLRLAIVTGSYDDVERYYRIFTNIDERNPELVKYVCAALVVCGKYYLQQGLGTRAMELFQKSAITAAGSTRILREIIQTLVDAGMAKQADEYLRRFPPDTQSGADYLSMRFLIISQTAGNSRILEVGQDLLTKNIHEAFAYRIMIEKCVLSQLPKAAQNLVSQASERWPGDREKFEGLLASTTAAKAAQ